MIDSRDYKTSDELADAMQFEHYISELDFLNKTLTELKRSFGCYKRRLERSVREIKSKTLELQNNIDEYYKKQRKF